MAADPWGDLGEHRSFLACVGSRERSWLRLAGVLAAGGALALIALGAVMLLVLGLAALITWAASGGEVSIVDAVGRFSDTGRTGRTLQGYSYELASVGMGSIAAALAFVLVAARLYQRPLRTFLTSAAHFRWRLVLLGLAISLPIVGGSVALDYLGADAPQAAPIFSPGAAWWARAVYVAAACGFLCLAALAEEILFRGWLLQQTYAFVRNVALLLTINGLLFSAVHFDPSPGPFLIRAAMGAAWSWVVLRTGGLEFALGAHLANNLMVSLFIKPVTFAPVVRQPIDYRELAVQVASLALMVVIVEALIRSRSLPDLSARRQSSQETS